MPFHAQFDLQDIVNSLKSNTIPPGSFGLQIGSWDKFTLEKFGNLRIKHFAALLKVLPDNKREKLIYLQRAWSDRIPPKIAKKLIVDYTKASRDPDHFKIPKAAITNYISSYKDPDYRLTFKFGCTDINSGLCVFLHVMGVNGKNDAPDYIECLINSSTATTVTPHRIGTGNLSTKTDNYFRTRARSDGYKQGIAHIIISTDTELGVSNFLETSPNSAGDTLYIFPAHGQVKQSNGSYRNQNTLVLSFINDITSLSDNSTKSDLLYDLGGACCPPQ